MNKIKDKVPYPSDWKVKKLGELGSFLKGKGISKSETKESGLPCIRYGEIYTRHHNYIKEFYSFIDEETAKNSTRIRKGDILFAGSGETMEEIGKSVAFLHEEQAYAGGDIIILRTKDVDSQYLAFALNEGRLAKERAKLGQGHSVVHIYPKELKELIIHLPSNIEQQKIASILSTWDKAIELKEKLIEQKKAQKKGLMQKLLTGEVRLPGYEGEWKSVELKHVVEKVIDNRGKTPPLSTEGFELIEVNALEGNKFPDYLKVKKYVDDTTYWTWFRNGHPQKDDILVATVGSVGSTVIMNENRGCIAQNLIALRIKEEYNAEFIYYWMNSNQYFSLINKVLMGAVQPSLKVPHLLQFEIQLPIQREQEKIAEILSNHDETIRLLEREIIYLKQQKQGLMQLLLTGKVRVKV